MLVIKFILCLLVVKMFKYLGILFLFINLLINVYVVLLMIVSFRFLKNILSKFVLFYLFVI